jgi:hypothetical protein
LLVAIAGVCAAAVAFAAQSPKALRASILSAASAQHSVHYVTTDVGPARLRMVADVARDHGIQRIAFTKGVRTGHVTVIVAHRTVYLRGDAFTMKNYMGFSSSQASRYQGRWISMAHTWSGYKTVSAAVTLGSFLHELGPKGPLVRISGHVDGRAVTGVRGGEVIQGVHVSEILYAARGTLLPVLVNDVAKSRGYSSRTVMTSWGEPVRVQIPAKSVPVSVVVRS